MKCCLCGLEKKLIEAHVIPRSFHRIDPKDKQPLRLVTNIEGRYSQKLRKGVYDGAILCEDCEHKFSEWDNYGNELFLKSWESAAPILHDDKVVGYKWPDYDYSKLKLFILSVLWRSSVSGHPMYAKIDLGPREAPLRDAVLRRDPGDKNFFGVVLQAFDTTEVGVLDPHPERFGPLRFVRLYLAHVIAFIKVDSRPFEEPFLSMALGSSNELVLAKKNFLTSPERRIMKSMVVADREKSRGGKVG